MTTPEFSFQMSEEAAHKNWSVLKRYNLDLSQALEANKSSQLGYGSEFRPVSSLDRIFKNHPLWTRLSSQLKNGADSPLEELNNDTRYSDLQDALDFGNHKGADENPALFEKMMNEDVTHGYSLIIPRNKVKELKGALISTMNIANQSGINECGEIISKSA